MIQDVKYNGYSASPSDYEIPDGELACSMNLIKEVEGVKALYPPSLIFHLTDGQKVSHIHTTNSFKHYIISSSSNQIYWVDDKDEKKELKDLHVFDTDVKIHQIHSIGNTIEILTDNGMFYTLWKEDSQNYSFLGNSIPECSISLGLRGVFKKSDIFAVPTMIPDVDLYKKLKDAEQKNITPHVLGYVNKFIAENSVNAGRFIFPFLVRYAYRLYDDTLIKHSAPVFMACSTRYAPVVIKGLTSGNNHTTTQANLFVVGMFSQLDYQARSNMIEELKPWQDIVKSVDIFISKPIYTYDQNGYCQQFHKGVQGFLGQTLSVCKHTNQNKSIDTHKYPSRYQVHDWYKLYRYTFCHDPKEDALTNVPENPKLPYGVLEIPYKSVTDIDEEIRSTSEFFLLKSIKIDDLSTEGREVIDVGKEYLQSLVNRELMTDDYDSHDMVIPRYAYTYNERLNIANLKKQLFEGFDVSSMVFRSDGFIRDAKLENQGLIPANPDTTTTYEVLVYIKENGQDVIVKSRQGTIAKYCPLFYLYYPNPNAYKIILKPLGGNTAYEIPLKKHDFLNGSYCYGSLDLVMLDALCTGDLIDNSREIPLSEIPTPSIGDHCLVELANKVYTSEVQNPFVFPLLGINTVGTGEIIAITTASKALSAGQKGQFPLYILTTSGIWAMRVSSTGNYESVDSVTRDVCLSANSVSQLDSEVVFATDRGVMMLSGSQSICISDILDSEDMLTIKGLPLGEDMVRKIGLNPDDFTLIPFKEYVKKCRFLYDYVHQHIVVYNTALPYAYVFSLESKQWGMMQSNIDHSVNSYPEAMAMLKNGDFVDFSRNGSKQPLKGILISRPLKLGVQDVLKTVNTVIQRGVFVKGHVSCVLYGSRDLHKWFSVWSSVDHIMRGFRGTPYKYYRIALLCQLDSKESLTGATFQFDTKRMNQPR